MRTACAAAILMAAALNAQTKVTHAPFGKTHEGAAVEVYTLKNRHGIEAHIITYGGRLQSLKTPDSRGNLGDIVLGFDSIDGYLDNPGPFFGALIGRYANRIGGAKFSLDGVEYKLDKNDGANTLHGGAHGFDKAIWKARTIDDGIELTYISKDGEQGFPGNLTARVTYTLDPTNTLTIHYEASADKPTVVNLTNHAYFNLKGEGTILGHRLTLNADRFTPVDAGLIPTGELRDVAGTPFDFRKPEAIGTRITVNNEQLNLGKGYDHNWVLNGSGTKFAARVEEPITHRVLEVSTTEPGIQFYSGNFLDGTAKGKGGKMYAHRSGFCLETQHFPDSPNQPKFPSVVLKPGGKFESTTSFRFLTN
jgi:aldose 1-epimerase